MAAFFCYDKCMTSKEVCSPSSDIDVYLGFLMREFSKDEALNNAEALGLDIKPNQLVETKESVSGVIDLNKLLGF
jgi:hypothetical protein